MIHRIKHIFIFSALIINLHPALASTDQEKEKSLLIDELIQEHGFDEQYVLNIFGNTKYLPQLIESISKPAERTKTWPEYRNIFVTKKRIAAGVLFAKQHEEIIDRAAREMGVPRKILLGILGVETYFGRIQGSYKVMDSLYTLATGYPPRAKFFRSELINLFYLSREENLPILDIKGSYAGAMGASQFISSSYRNYAVDGNDDGKIDLFNSWDDVLISIGNYLKQNGWDSSEEIYSRYPTNKLLSSIVASKTIKPTSTVQDLLNEGVEISGFKPDDVAQLIQLDDANVKDDSYIGHHNFYVITTYNRNVMYALVVVQLGEAIESYLD
jgi:membrane-bound lytic murein transglycosylase B|tara:strand:- start:870 stop:1853 length:984 start_codon:yes stop_codon:yes gene_type:complete